MRIDILKAPPSESFFKENISHCYKRKIVYMLMFLLCCFGFFFLTYMRDYLDLLVFGFGQVLGFSLLIGMSSFLVLSAMYGRYQQDYQDISAQDRIKVYHFLNDQEIRVYIDQINEQKRDLNMIEFWALRLFLEEKNQQQQCKRLYLTDSIGVETNYAH